MPWLLGVFNQLPWHSIIQAPDRASLILTSIHTNEIGHMIAARMLCQRHSPADFSTSSGLMEIHRCDITCHHMSSSQGLEETITPKAACLRLRLQQSMALATSQLQACEIFKQGN